MKIKDISKKLPRINIVDKTKRKVDPEEVAKALGAEIVGHFNTGGGPIGAFQAYEQYKLLQEERYYLEFANACAIGMPDKNCLKYFKRYDTKELPRVIKIIGMLKSINPSTLLDIGSGRGRLLWPMAYNFPDLQITCVDKCDWRVNVINAVNAGGVSRIKSVLADSSNLPFENNSFDVVVASEIIEHIPDAPKAVSEMIRVSKNYFVASVPSKPDENPDHLHYFTQADFQNILDGCGKFSKICFEYVKGCMVIFVRK